MGSRLLLALVTVAAVLAGCTGDGGDPPATTTATTTTPEPTTTTPGPVTSTPPPATTTPPPATTTPPVNETPRVNVSLRHDYSAAAENVTFTIPEDAGNLTLTINFDVAPLPGGAAYACAGDLRLVILRPDGAIHRDVRAGPTTAQTPEAHCAMVGPSDGPADFPPGEWRVGFEGSGVGFGWVRVESAPAAS